MKATTQGFSLIELMVVVAIIGILSAIALPAYATYQARAKLTAGLAEVSGLRTAAEQQLNDGHTVASITDLPGATATSSHCTLAASFALADGSGTLSCAVLAGPPAVSNAVLVWSRSVEGQWRCAVDGLADPSLAPRSCPAS